MYNVEQNLSSSFDQPVLTAVQNGYAIRSSTAKTKLAVSQHQNTASRILVQ